MGFGGISIWQLLIILLIVIMLFGTKKLRNMGTDLGGAIKGFKKALNTEGKKDTEGKKSIVADDARPLESDQDKAVKHKDQV